MEIRGIRALVTGANRGIGRAFVDELLARGAAEVFAGVRTDEAAAAIAAISANRNDPLHPATTAATNAPTM